MLGLQYIRENPEVVKQAIKEKGVDLNLDDLLRQDAIVTEMKRTMQSLDTERNKLSKLVAGASPDERPPLVARSRELREQADALKPSLREAEQRLQDYLWLVPNIPMESAPIGLTEADNTIVRSWGEPPKFSFTPRDHVELLQINGWAELDRVTRVCGSRTYALCNELLRLELALHFFVMDKLQERKFTVISVPSLAYEQAFYGTGHFPTGRDNVYHLPKDNVYLSGTAEIVLTGLHSGEILNESDLPILYAGFSPCFRRESGSAGQDVRGIIRVHQFTKVEQYVICKNSIEESAAWHAKLLALAEEVVQDLELPYHVIECCTGDMGVGKYRMNDIEVWVPTLGRYRETHSCSTLHEWQARRANIRYRTSEGKVEFAHTLNNTGIATPRILVPFLENHQLQDGRVRLPKCLRSFFHGVEIIGKGSA